MTNQFIFNKIRTRTDQKTIGQIKDFYKEQKYYIEKYKRNLESEIAQEELYYRFMEYKNRPK